jgi:DNA-binding NtrC family response regulator
MKNNNLQRKWTILLVDDEPQVTLGMIRALSDTPYVFLAANSGKEALEILARIPIDVVVSDEEMPEMSGSELLTQVRHYYPDVIRIMLTGRASVKSAITATQDGWVYQYLHKPCEPAAMANCIHNGITLRSLSGGGASLVMSVDSQEKLLERVAEKRSDASAEVPTRRHG